MKVKYYKHIHTGEIIYEDEAELYAMNQLGVIITTQDKNGILTEEQKQFINDFKNWFFSGNWIEEWEEIN
ncbi:MAG: hypothetical protein J6D03_02900 [Clostridia bacterium]|nr:hypothetical protein [Clostridia bacterium]